MPVLFYEFEETLPHILDLNIQFVGPAHILSLIVEQSLHLVDEFIKVFVVTVYQFLSNGLQVYGSIRLLAGSLGGVAIALNDTRILGSHKYDVVGVVVQDTEAVPCDVHPAR